MNDKVITTFVTEITWYFTKDKLPKLQEMVLIYRNNKVMSVAKFRKGWLRDDEFLYFATTDNYCYIDEIKYWAEIPEFE